MRIKKPINYDIFRRRSSGLVWENYFDKLWFSALKSFRSIISEDIWVNIMESKVLERSLKAGRMFIVWGLIKVTGKYGIFFTGYFELH